jgi:hypothetical protein
MPKFHLKEQNNNKKNRKNILGSDKHKQHVGNSKAYIVMQEKF